MPPVFSDNVFSTQGRSARKPLLFGEIEESQQNPTNCTQGGETVSNEDGDGSGFRFVWPRPKNGNTREHNTGRRGVATKSKQQSLIRIMTDFHCLFVLIIVVDLFQTACSNNISSLLPCIRGFLKTAESFREPENAKGKKAPHRFTAMMLATDLSTLRTAHNIQSKLQNGLRSLNEILGWKLS